MLMSFHFGHIKIFGKYSTINLISDTVLNDLVKRVLDEVSEHYINALIYIEVYSELTSFCFHLTWP